MNDADPRTYAVKLLERDRVRIAAAIARQLALIVPKYRTIAPSDVEESVQGTLAALTRFVLGDNEQKLLNQVDRVFERRAAEGFSAADLVMTTHAYLPVLRRFFCERSDDLRLGVAAYEEVESTALGLMRHLVVLALEARAVTDPGFTQKPISQSFSWPPAPVLVEAVED